MLFFCLLFIWFVMEMKLHKFNIMKKQLLLAFCFWMAFLSAFSHNNYMFKYLEVKDGLSNNQTNAIYKDSRGFMWFGTISGLNRYDGYHFKIFRMNRLNQNTLPDNYIETITEDGDGRLWIRTSEGYAIYDHNTETFMRSVRDWMRGIGIDGIPQRVYVDQQKNTWFYVESKGCFCYQRSEKETKALLFDNKGLPDGNITDIKECKGDLLMVYNDGRVVCVDKKKMVVKWTLSDITRQLVGRESDDFFLFVDSDADMWVYSNSGVWVYSVLGKKWLSEWHRDLRRDPHNIVHAIAQDKLGRIWLGKAQEGIEILNKRDGQSIFLTCHSDNERGLLYNTINTLYQDEDGVMWVGMYKKGIAYYDGSIYKFGINRLGDINCIEEGTDGNLWLGTNDAGLLCWNSVTGEKKQYVHQDKNSLSSDGIVSLLRGKDGRLWIGTLWGGLDCFDGKRFVHYKNHPGDSRSLANNNVWALAEDKNGNIWIGTLGGGLQCLDPKSGSFVTYNISTSNIVSNYISSLCIARDNQLFIGTSSTGVAILDLDTRKFTNLVGNKSGSARFSNQFINQVFEDSRGLIWIATRDGLNLYNPKNDHLQIVSPSPSVSGQFITGITEDENKNLWVTMANGVMNIVPSIDRKAGANSFEIYTYDDKDGLQSSEFNQRSIKRLSTGEIVIGGGYGINRFFPENIKYNRALPKVMFVGLQLFNDDVEVGKAYEGRVLLKKYLNETHEITLNYRQNVFTVLFASDNYILPNKTQYVYKLEGFDGDWMKSSADVHRATYTNLAPGKYILRVKAINSDGYAGTEESCLKIVILPPFWMTPWAYVVYALLFLGGLAVARNEILRHERNKFKMQQIEREAQKNEEVNQMKFRFFTNVSHELRTPLTLIISPLESLMKENVDKLHLDQFKLMHRNALRLLNLVNQLLDFRKNEVSGLHLDLSEGEIVAFIQNVCNSFLMLSERKNIHLTFFSAMDSLNMSFDEDKIGKVVMNLLSNAFKFTPEGGRVDVALEVIHEDTDTLEIKVSDTGVGITDADKSHIFERFYQTDRKNDNHSGVGSGIGLSLVRDFVTLHGGVVRVFDNVGSGTVFVVHIPVKHSAVGVVTPLSEEAATEDAVALANAAVKEQHNDNILLENVVSKKGFLSELDLPIDEKKALSDTTQNEERKPLALIVDDNEDFISFMRYTLSLYFRVQAAANGREAWQIIQELTPDIIVSDVMMPEMDGNELCRLVKADSRTNRIPFVLLTARQSVENKVEGLKLGADDYVTKPFNMEVLILRMRKLIDLSLKNQLRTHIDPEPDEIIITSMDEKLVENAIKYVEFNISRTDLSVEELSHELGMSRVHLYKKLLQITGKTPIEFIRIIRLKRAAQLLRESQQNISEIAYQVGFNNPKYFSKYFKDEFGVLPSIYQEKEGK